MSRAYDKDGNLIPIHSEERDETGKLIAITTKIAMSSEYGKFGRGFDPSIKTFQPIKTWVRPNRKIGRNDPCPCRSGRKYKKCHGE